MLGGLSCKTFLDNTRVGIPHFRQPLIRFGKRENVEPDATNFVHFYQESFFPRFCMGWERAICETETPGTFFVDRYDDSTGVQPPDSKCLRHNRYDFALANRCLSRCGLNPSQVKLFPLLNRGAGFFKILQATADFDTSVVDDVSMRWDSKRRTNIIVR